jgi:hypothetical protein
MSLGGKAKTLGTESAGNPSKMSTHLLVLCILNLAVATHLASALPAGEEWKISMRTPSVADGKVPGLRIYALSRQMGFMHEATRKRGSSTGGKSAAGGESQGVPGEQVIALFLIFGLFLSAGWGCLIALMTVALRFGMQGT